MRLARILNFAGTANAVLVLVVWYGERFYWGLWEQWASGTSVIDIIASINNFQKVMMVFPVSLLVLFLQVHFAIPDKALGKGWGAFAIINVVVGLSIASVGWFPLGVGLGWLGIVVWLLPCVLACAVIMLMFWVHSPLCPPSSATWS